MRLQVVSYLAKKLHCSIVGHIPSPTCFQKKHIKQQKITCLGPWNISFKNIYKSIHNITSWWFQPPWKIIVKMGIQLGLKMKNIWNHKLDNIYLAWHIELSTNTLQSGRTHDVSGGTHGALWTQSTSPVPFSWQHVKKLEKTTAALRECQCYKSIYSPII